MKDWKLDAQPVTPTERLLFALLIALPLICLVIAVVRFL